MQRYTHIYAWNTNGWDGRAHALIFGSSRTTTIGGSAPIVVARLETHNCLSTDGQTRTLKINMRLECKNFIFLAVVAHFFAEIFVQSRVSRGNKTVSQQTRGARKSKEASFDQRFEKDSLLHSKYDHHKMIIFLSFTSVLKSLYQVLILAASLHPHACTGVWLRFCHY